MLEADLSVEMASDAVAVTKKMAREAKTSVVVAVSAGYGTPSEAVQILMESTSARRVLIIPTPPSSTKRSEWESESIQILVTAQREGPDFVLVDGLNLAFGGVASSSSTVITVRAHSALDGVIAWLEGRELTIPRDEKKAAGDLVSDLRAFEYELADLQGEVTMAKAAETQSAEEAVGMARIRQYLKERSGAIEARLLQMNPFPFAWLSPLEVPTLVEQWGGKIRVVVRSEASPLARAAT
ncbi:MAG TPA: hypothetical protein VEO55_11140, partial [Candidatus Dormibacteraeota bacterium]|nr:hypothetical protein [Candidatus Dormibacteraeota bacterium]